MKKKFKTVVLLPTTPLQCVQFSESPTCKGSWNIPPKFLEQKRKVMHSNWLPNIAGKPLFWENLRERFLSH